MHLADVSELLLPDRCAAAADAAAGLRTGIEHACGRRPPHLLRQCLQLLDARPARCGRLLRRTYQSMSDHKDIVPSKSCSNEWNAH